MSRGATTSLFLQTLGLVGVTLAAVFVATTLVVLNIPPPAPDIYTVSEVAQALHTGRPVAAAEGRQLDVVRVGRPPGATIGWRHLIFRALLAKQLKVAEADVVVAQMGPRLVYSAPARWAHPPPGAAGSAVMFGAFAAALHTPHGDWLVVSPKHAWLQPWQVRELLVLLVAAVAVTPLVWLFAHRIAAPMEAFARAAERLGRDPDAPPLSIGGSSEVDAAVAAFNLMQERLKRYVTNRTTMLGAIAHDLRTPLTRLRFRIEAAPEALKAKLAADVDEMEAMVSSALAFVQDETRRVERTRLEVASIVGTVIDDAAETGADAVLGRRERAVIDGDPIAMKRLVTNLVGNALKFGGQARSRVFSEGGMAIIEVDDDGPGLPEADFERAFEPFYRLETSRSRETGGAGLGLAVVRAIARAHGGEVTLQNRAEGGLRARVCLPLAPPAAHQSPRVKPSSAGISYPRVELASTIRPASSK